MKAVLLKTNIPLALAMKAGNEAAREIPFAGILWKSEIEIPSASFGLRESA